MVNYRDFTDSLIQSLSEDHSKAGVVQIREEMIDLIPESTLISIIKKHHPDIKITNTLIERYRGLAKSMSPTPDKAVSELRNLNPADSVFEDHVEYRLDDGQLVVISEQMNNRLNKVLSEHPIVLTYISESVGNFMDVINELEE